MDKSLKWSSGFLVFLFLIVLPFHNCTVDKSVRFSDLSSDKINTSLRSESNGTGGVYLGKPIEGEYVRRFPGYLCGNSPQTSVNEQGLLFVKNDIKVVRDNCLPKEIQFNFTDSLVVFSNYNPDYLALGAAIYEYKKPSSKDFSVTEVWCSIKSSDFNLDIVTKVGGAAAETRAKIYLSAKNKVSQTESFVVDRSDQGKSLSYSSAGLNLKVIKPLVSSQTSSGYFETLIDDIAYTGQLSCRVATNSALEEMGTSLATLYPLNSLTVDQQESICSHSGVLACDNLEDRTSAADLARAKSFNLGWQWEPGGYAVSNVSFDGGKGFEAINVVDGTGTGSIGFPFPAASEIYVRYYAKWSSNFVFSPQATGLFSVNGATNELTLKSFFDSNRKLNLQMKNGIYNSNFQPDTNQWYCLEVHVKSASSSSSLDGQAQIWVDGNKIIETPNLNLSDTMSIWAFYGNWYCADSDGNLRCDDPAYAHPKQSLFYDNIVIAKQRVGCF